MRDTVWVLLAIAGFSLTGCGRPLPDDDPDPAPADAVLVFRLVHRESDSWVARLRAEGKAPPGYRWHSHNRVLVKADEAVADDAPREDLHLPHPPLAEPGSTELMLEPQQQDDGTTAFVPYFVETEVQLTGAAVSAAAVGNNVLGQPVIEVRFTREGRRQFAELTRNHAPGGSLNAENERGRQLAIILEGRLVTAPEIRTEIPGGRAEIMGVFTEAEARRLAELINAGR